MSGEFGDSEARMKKRQGEQTNEKERGGEGSAHFSGEASLPPLRVSDKDASDLHLRTNGSSKEEWIVSRPKRVKPRDLLRLEGPMDMQTTFSSSYDAAAKEIEEILAKSLKMIEDEGSNDAYEGTVKTRRSRHRPKTSLKLSGPHYYDTVNRQCFKKFVIVDDKISDHSSSLEVKGQGEARVSSKQRHAGVWQGVHSPPGEETRAHDAVNRERPSPVETQVQNTAASSKYTAPLHPKESEAIKDEAAGLTSDLKSPLQQPLRSLKPAEAGQEETKATQAARLLHQTKETIHSSHQSLSLDDRVTPRNITREHSTKSTHAPDFSLSRARRRRPQSLPRQMTLMREYGKVQEKADEEFVHPESSNHKEKDRRDEKPRLRRKNDSQLKFDGDMCFETTSHSNFVPFKQCLKTDERRPRVKRNLFERSNEVHHSPSKEKMNSETTYSLFFRRKTHCPALDLDTSLSEYTFKNESSGHRFYCPCNKL